MQRGRSAQEKSDEAEDNPTGRNAETAHADHPPKGAGAQLAQVQLPAIRITLVLGVVTLSVMAGIRQLGAAPWIGLIAGVLAAAGTAAAAVWLVPTLALGDHGTRLLDILREHILPRLRPARVRRSV